MSEHRALSMKQGLTAPGQLLYTLKHTWAQITPEGNVRVGVSDYARRYLKGIANVITEPVGREVVKMEPFGAIETWMFMFNLYSPISGEIIKVNEKLRDRPYLVYEDPYGEGWIVEIKPRSPPMLEEELKDLLSAEEYGKWISKLEGRLCE